MSVKSREVVWKISRGSGGFKATFEQVSVRKMDDKYRVAKTTPISVTTVGMVENVEEAIELAEETAEEWRFDVSEAEVKEELV